MPQSAFRTMLDLPGPHERRVRLHRFRPRRGAQWPILPTSSGGLQTHRPGPRSHRPTHQDRVSLDGLIEPSLRL